MSTIAPSVPIPTAPPAAREPELTEIHRIATEVSAAQSRAFARHAESRMRSWAEAVQRTAAAGARPASIPLPPLTGQAQPAPGIPGLLPRPRRPWKVAAPYQTLRSAPYTGFGRTDPSNPIHAVGGDGSEDTVLFAAIGFVDMEKGELRAELAGGVLGDIYDPGWQLKGIFQIAQSTTSMNVYFSDLPRYYTESIASFDVSLEVPTPGTLLAPGTGPGDMVGAFASITLTLHANSPLPLATQSHGFFQRTAVNGSPDSGSFEPPPWLTGAVVLAPNVTAALVTIQLDLLIARTPVENDALPDSFAGIDNFQSPGMMSPWAYERSGPIRVQSISCYSKPLP